MHMHSAQGLHTYMPAALLLAVLLCFISSFIRLLPLASLFSMSVSRRRRLSANIQFAVGCFTQDAQA